jgi:hypothetical protein
MPETQSAPRRWPGPSACAIPGSRWEPPKAPAPLFPKRRKIQRDRQIILSVPAIVDNDSLFKQFATVCRQPICKRCAIHSQSRRQLPGFGQRMRRSAETPLRPHSRFVAAAYSTRIKRAIADRPLSHWDGWQPAFLFPGLTLFLTTKSSVLRSRQDGAH